MGSRVHPGPRPASFVPPFRVLLYGVRTVRADPRAPRSPRRENSPMTLPSDLRIVDCDSHLTESHDLWTKRAPAAYKHRVPRVEQVEGRATWLMEDGRHLGGLEGAGGGGPRAWLIEDGQHRLGFAGGGGVVDREGKKVPFLTSLLEWGIEDVHVAAWDTKVRLAMLDEFGIHAQVMYPNSIGLGGQDLQIVKSHAFA